MLKICALLIIFVSCGCAMTDLKQICNDIADDDEVVPHPLDCSAYFVCSKVPTIHYCDNDQHFDAKHKVCDLPEIANCKLKSKKKIKIDNANINVNMNDDTKIANVKNNIEKVEKKKIMNVEEKIDDVENRSVNMEKKSLDVEKKSLNSDQIVSEFIAIDIETGKSTQPLDKFNPKHVECVHYGAYFLPHPNQCNQFYLCAYGHLHQHSCGRGTLWNYEHGQCEVANLAICYPNAEREPKNNIAENNPQTTLVYEATVCYPIYTTVAITTSWPSTETTPNFSNNTTAATTTASVSSTAMSSTYNPNYTVPTLNVETTTEHQHSETTPTWHSTGSTPNFGKNDKIPVHAKSTTKWHRTSTMPNSDFDNFNADSSEHPTPGTPSHPTPPAPSELNGTPSLIATTKRTTATTIVECPNSRQAYLSHPNDCSKYYICILGKAVLTSCPNGLFWDHDAEFCDLADNVNCTNT